MTNHQTLREQVAQAISYAIQGVREYTSNDIEDYYANRAKWVTTETNAILALIATELKEGGPEEEQSGCKQHPNGSTICMWYSCTKAGAFNEANAAWRTHIDKILNNE